MTEQRKATGTPFGAFNTHIMKPIVMASDGEPQLVKLTLACDVKGMRKLLEAGEDPNVRGRNNLPAIFWATTVFKNAPLQLLLEFGAEVNMPPEAHETPITHAARVGDLTKTRILLDAGADPNTITADHPILCRIAEGSHHGCAALLIERGANVHATNMLGCQPIHRAARSGYPDMLGVLLRAGADLAAPNREGKLPLEMAVERGRVEAVKILLDAGAAPGNDLEDDRYWAGILTGANPEREANIRAIQRIVRAALLARHLDGAMGSSDSEPAPSPRGPGPL